MKVADPLIDVIVEEGLLTREQATDALAGWTFHPYFLGGRLAAVAMTSGPEIHFTVVKEFRNRGIQRGRIVEFLKPFLERIPYLTTRVALDRHRQMRFVERVGFKKTWTDGHQQFYMLTKLRHAR